jgi:C4-dicarboxylate transporter DctM subunit
MRSVPIRYPAALGALLPVAALALGGWGGTWIWWLLVPLLAILGTPLFAVLALAALVAFQAEQISSSAVTAEMVRLAGSPVLISIPLFTLAGYIAAESGTPRRLVRLTSAALGWFPGGLAIVAMIACSVFTAFTGASGVTIIAMGGLLMPALLKEKYPERFTLGLLTTGGSLGILFPPSLALILYSYVASTSAGANLTNPLQGPTVDRLFLAGILPGVLLILLLSILAFWTSRHRPVVKAAFRWRELAGALREAAWEVPLPFVLLGGIYGGKLTVTDAAAATALYVLVVEVFIYRDLPLRRLPAVAAEAMTLVGGILIILASAMGLTNYLIDAQVPMAILAGIEHLIQNRLGFLLALNVLLLIVGCLMDIFSALIVVVPLIVPIAMRYGVDLTHLGIIFLTNLEIGYSTPPVGMNLFISSFRFKQPIMRVYAASVPFLLMLLAALLLVTYLPDISLLLVRLFG